MRTALLALLVLASGCGGSSAPEDGYALAAEVYRQHFAQGRHEVLLRSSVTIRGGSYLITLYDGASGTGENYLIPRPQVRDGRVAEERAREAVTPYDEIVRDLAVLDTLARVVSSFEQIGAWRVRPHGRSGGASVYLTPQDVLDYAGLGPDTRPASFREELQPIAPAWSYRRLSSPADA